MKYSNSFCNITLRQKVRIKLFILLVFLCNSYIVFSQSHPSRNIVIHGRDTLIELSILIKRDVDIKLKDDKNYHWYAFDKIRTNQGAFSGHLLHGGYKRYLGDYNLVESGSFNLGLQEGIWKVWDLSGTIISELEMKEGLKHGTCKFYQGGNLVRTEEYEQGHLHGKTVLYEGEIEEELRYKHGELIEPKAKERDKDKKRLTKKIKDLFSKKEKNEKQEKVKKVRERKPKKEKSNNKEKKNKKEDINEMTS